MPKATKAEIALLIMWEFASLLVEKHGMNGDDSMTDEEHEQWQRAAGLTHDALNPETNNLER